jgi:hypothetical protein
VAIFLFLILVAVVLGIIGAVVNGLFWLLIIGIVVFLLAFVVLSRMLKGGRRRHPAR